MIFAGAAAPTEHGAGYVVLRMGEITLIDCISSEQAVKEVERNLAEKISEKLPDFHLLVSRSLRIIKDPLPGELAIAIIISALRNRSNRFEKGFGNRGERSK